MNRIKTLFWRLCERTSIILHIGVDKSAHFYCCFVSSIVIGSIFGITTGLVASITLGIGKEYGDYCAVDNDWSWGDILADIVGAIVGSLAVYGILFIINIC